MNKWNKFYRFLIFFCCTFSHPQHWNTLRLCRKTLCICTLFRISLNTIIIYTFRFGKKFNTIRRNYWSITFCSQNLRNFHLPTFLNYVFIRRYMLPVHFLCLSISLAFLDKYNKKLVGCPTTNIATRMLLVLLSLFWVLKKHSYRQMYYLFVIFPSAFEK